MPNNFCIATITLARTPEEEELMRASLLQLLTLNIPVFVTDGGSLHSFLQFLQSNPLFTLLPQQTGVYAQAKSSVQAAFNYGCQYVLYTEPDKKNFFTQHLSSFLNKADLDDTTGIILAARSASALATFPAFQQRTENMINDCCAEVTGKRFDFTYGPFLINRKLIPYINNIQEDVGWGWRPFLFGMAHRLGLKINAVTGHYSCPAIQQQDDSKERLYRIKQLQQNIQGLLLSTTATTDADTAQPNKGF